MGKDGNTVKAENEIFTSIDGYTDTSSVTGEGSFIVYGGSALSEFVQHEIRDTRTGQVAIVARMDISTNVIRWMRQYDVDDSDFYQVRKSKYVNGLSIKEDGTQVAVYASTHTYDTGHEYGYIFILRALDGALVHNKATRI